MDNIIKSIYDEKKYYSSTLENKIKYTIITDKLYTETFVIFLVNSGSYNEPVGYDGLAHFLEHLIFFGSEKYPNVNLLTEVSQNGGSSNAFTSPFETAYHFNVLNEYVERTLDVFSSALIKPLFLEKNIKSEINAVNNEFLNTIQNDNYICNYFIHTLINSHPQLNTLSVGNKKTLNKPDILDKIKKYYNDYYTSDNISVCIYSSLSKDNIESLIVKYLSNIPYKKHKNSTYELLNKHVFNKNINNTFYIQSLKKCYNMLYLWNMPNKLNHIENKEFEIIADILSNESKNSIIHYLKNMGFLNNLNIVIEEEGIFMIYLSLTCDGLKNYDKIENMLLTYLNKIINYDNKKYAEYFQKKNKLFFDYNNFDDVSDISTMICSNSFYYDTKNLLFGDYKINNIKSNEEYKKIYNNYLGPNNLIKIISTNKYPFNDYNKLKHYNIKHTKLNHIINIDNKLDLDIDKLYNIDETFLDINSKIINIKEEIPTNNKTSWFYGNSSFNNPMVNIYLFFYKNNNINTSYNFLLSSISINIINYIIKIELHDILESLFDVNVGLNNNNIIVIEIIAINDIQKIKLFINKINDLINNLSKDEYIKNIISDIYIDNVIKTVKEKTNNIKYSTPLEIAQILFNENIYKYYYNYKKLLVDIDLINSNKIREHIKILFSNTLFSSFIAGNITNDENILNVFNKYEKKYFDININNNQKKKIYEKHPNDNEKSIGLFYYYPIEYNLKNIVLLELLNIILNQLFFDILRTKHQLGYIVKMSIIKIKNKLYLTEKIQSDQNIYKLKKLVKMFNSNITKYINECDYDKYINILRTKYKNPCNNLSEQIIKYFNEIINREFIFDRNEHLLKILDTISKDELISFSEYYINKSNRYEIIIF